MTLEDFLIHIEHWIQRLHDIQTEDPKLRELLLKIMSGKNIFECIQSSIPQCDRLSVHSLDSVRELGYYLKHNRHIQQSIRGQLIYPVVLTIASFVQAAALAFFFPLPIWYTVFAPIALVICVAYVFEKTTKKLNSLLQFYWLKCFLSKQIDIRSLERNTQLSLRHVKSVEELAFCVTGSSNSNVQVLHKQYTQGIRKALKDCKNYMQLTCQIMMVVIGIQMLYMLLNFHNHLTTLNIY